MLGQQDSHLCFVTLVLYLETEPLHLLLQSWHLCSETPLFYKEGRLGVVIVSFKNITIDSHG